MTMETFINYYYDQTELGEYSTDPDEGNLVKLCDPCAARAHDILWAGAGDEESRCELCGLHQATRFAA